jgi:hypothetical protein
MLKKLPVVEGPNVPIDFEEGGNGADWTWTVFENDDNPELEIIANPDASGANTSATVAKFTARAAGNPWAGVESMHGADLGTFTLDETNNQIKIMVWKSVISDVGIKLVASSGWAQPEIKVANTLVNQWEELTFDFSDYINPPDPELGMLDQIVIFPDYNLDGRGQENIVYFDNVTFNAEEVPVVEGPNVPIDFEEGGNGADWTWTVFENDDDPALEIIANPDASGINTSATVAKFTARAAGNPWAGVESMHGADLGTFTLDETNNQIKIMVWKSVISDVGIKLVASSGWAQPEIKVANTLVNQWEELTFDFSDYINPPDPELGMLDQIVIFPDFGERRQDNVVYFDNITFNAEEVPVVEGPNVPIDFEEGGNGADWTWTVFENDDNPALEIIANPDASGINTSATVAKFTARAAGNPWAGVESMHGADLGTFVLDETNNQIKIMVWKSVISDVGIKLVASSGWAQPEIKVANTLVNQWEELTFDFSDYINPPDPELGMLDQIVIFPDFGERAGDNVVYFDNITFNALPEPTYKAGWHGISSNVIPENPALEVLFAPVLEEMTILLSTGGIFWPSQNINTLGDWDTYQGYKVRFNAPVNYEFSGLPLTDRTVTFEPGFYFVPVLSEGPVALGDVIDLEGTAVDLMFDLTNSLIYWPLGGIVPGVPSALETLYPGYAYLAKFSQTITIDFGAVPKKSSFVPIMLNKPENTTGWNDASSTGTQHILSIQASQLRAGDFVGAFDAAGTCVGLAQYDGNSQVLALVAFGNDITTQEKDGLVEDEPMSFRIFRDGSEITVTAIYDESLNHHDGKFAENGLSIITEFKMGATMIEDNNEISFNVYPNPATGVFTLSPIAADSYDVMITNMQGQQVYAAKINGKATINLTGQAKGLYFIRLSNSAQTLVKKIVIE